MKKVTMLAVVAALSGISGGCGSDAGTDSNNGASEAQESDPSSDFNKQYVKFASRAIKREVEQGIRDLQFGDEASIEFGNCELYDPDGFLVECFYDVTAFDGTQTNDAMATIDLDQSDDKELTIDPDVNVDVGLDYTTNLDLPNDYVVEP